MTSKLGEVRSTVVERDGKFMTIRASPGDVQVLKFQWRHKPVVEVGITALDQGTRGTYQVLVVDRAKITQLLGLVGVGVSDFYKTARRAADVGGEDGVVGLLQEAIDSHGGEIFFKSSWWENPNTGEANWFAYAVTTEQHVVVPHKVLEKKIQTMFKGFEVVREELHYTPVWHVRIRRWKHGGEEFTAFVVVSGGRNVKKGRIKVIPLVKVGSCDNSIRPVEYIEINHTRGWERRFDEALVMAHELLTRVREVIRLSMGREMTYEQIDVKVREVVSKLKISETKHVLVEQAVMNRIAQTRREGSLTAWDMAQAVTYVGSYPSEIGIEDVMTDYAQEQMQTLGYQAIVEG